MKKFTQMPTALFVGLSMLIAYAILKLIVFTSESTFGDLTAVDSYKPLIIIIPAMAGLLAYFIIGKKR